MTTDEQRNVARIERLERLLAETCAALLRAGTEQDGNWGHKASRETLAEVLVELRQV